MSNSQKVLDTIIDLHNTEQPITRETVSSAMNISMREIDAALTYLVDCGRIIRVQRGVFRPSTSHAPARLISQSELSDGCVMIEIGDDISLVLTPKEARILGTMLQGRALQYSQIETGQSMHALACSLELKLKALGN